MDRRLLVVGFGNTLRSDDGVGPYVAAALEEMDLPGVLTLECQQITPELAYPVSHAPAVVFVDAALDAQGRIELSAVEPEHSSLVLHHAPSVGTLLALARDAFGWAPPAWIVKVPVCELGFGETLSPLAASGAKTAVELIVALARNLKPTAQSPSGSGTPTRPHVQVRA